MNYPMDSASSKWALSSCLGSVGRSFNWLAFIKLIRRWMTTIGVSAPSAREGFMLANLSRTGKRPSRDNAANFAVSYATSR